MGADPPPEPSATLGRVLIIDDSRVVRRILQILDGSPLVQKVVQLLSRSESTDRSVRRPARPVMPVQRELA